MFALSRRFVLTMLFASLALPVTLSAAEQPAKQSQASAKAANQKLVVYSSRKEHLIKPLFDAYTAKTGVKIEYLTDSEAPLIARIKAEAKDTPADIFMTVDAGNLWFAAESGLLQPLQSEKVNQRIPAHLRDPQDLWTGLSIRARTIVYAPERISPEQIKSYEHLASTDMKGKLCLRTSKKVYNQSLVAMLIAEHGVEQAEAIVKGWVDNLAAAPFSNDTKAIQAVIAGRCDVTIVNTYYFGRLEKAGKAKGAKIFWPNQNTEQATGVHVNISGAGITKHAKSPALARELIEWLASEEAQIMYAGLNLEFPANPNVESVDQVKAWGSFKQDQKNLAQAGKLQAEAVKLMDRVGYR
jgi:iron(III) transport system substrate-binding protein